jgi:hypothetical protein
MRDEQSPGQSHNAPGAGPAIASSSSSLPDINVETYPFELVQHLLDQAAFFNLYSVAEPGRSGTALPAPGNSGGKIGFRLSDALHRFDVHLHPPSKNASLKATNIVGETVGRFTQRWMIIPDGFVALPNQEPPPTLLDTSRQQRFVMLDATCSFGDGRDGFRGFGTGLTFPVTDGGRSQLLAAAVGNIMEGFGKFRGHEGTYTYCGSLSPENGFRGNLLCRVMDPEGSLRTEAAVPTPEPEGVEVEPGFTYVMFRGQKKDRSQRTSYIFGPDGQINGLNVSQQLRLFQIDSTTRGRGSLRSMGDVGQVIGRMTARINFNLLNPGAPGTGVAPIPFKSYNEYTFLDGDDGEVIGSLVGDGGEGRTFNLRLSGAPGQAALRFGGFGPLRNGTGCFAGIEGLMTDNSVVGIAPHALSTLYVLRINDPERKYRADAGETRR